MHTTHAPAPWRLNADRDAVLDANGLRIAELFIDHSAPHPVRRFDANGALLHAAPDLLAACSALAENSRLVCNLDTGQKYYPITPDEMGAIRRAIAKAKGTP